MDSTFKLYVPLGYRDWAGLVCFENIKEKIVSATTLLWIKLAGHFYQ